jgi:malate dehydrogenase (oxaloacetate-decarboxylating)(NADP+)
MDGGVARVRVDINEYRDRLRKMQSRSHQVMGGVFAKAKQKLARIVFPEGHHPKILQAAEIMRQEAICEPVLLGPVDQIKQAIADLRLDDLEGVSIISPENSKDYARYADHFWKLRQRRGVTQEEALRRLRMRSYYGAVMLQVGDVDGLVTGLTTGYADAVRPQLEVIHTRPGHRAAGVYIVVTKNDFKFFADCTVNADPTADELADIAITTADVARFFDVKPRVAMLSYSTFGFAKGKSCDKVRAATDLIHQRQPDLEVDGEIQAYVALSSETRRAEFPFSTLTDDANVLVFPNLDAANIGYQLLAGIGGAEVIGPVLLGMHRPVSVLQMDTSVQSIVNLAAFTALRAQGDEFLY